MIKKIICPTDLSQVANNAIQYAAKLAQVYHAELLLLHVVQASLGISGAEAGEVELQLHLRCAEISKLFKVSVDYEVEVADSLSGHIASARQDHAIVVMGTNGIDTLYQRVFGANTYQVIKKTRCPMVIVPEEVSYRSISKIVFAWNYQEGEKSSFSDLLDLGRPFNPEYIFLHVSTHKPASATEVFEAMRHNIQALVGKDVKKDFAQVFATNVPQGIDSYMHKSGADLLAITYFNKKLLRAFFQGQVTKKFINHVEYPILVLHA